MENRVKILIADGNEEFCAHVKRRLEQVSGYEIVGTAADGQRAVELMRAAKPDVLVLDLMLSKLDGTFKPDQNITRAEAMTLINRVLERKPESPADLLTNMNKWTDNMDTSKWYYLDVQEATNSHGYTRKTFNYELWRQMLPDPDWSRYER